MTQPDRIDVSEEHFEHNLSNKLVMPTYPFGIRFHVSYGIGWCPFGNERCKTLNEALRRAKAWTTTERKRAVVFRRNDGLVKARFGEWA